MTEFDVSIEGLDSVKAELDATLERVETDVTFKVGAGAEYAVFLEFGTEDMPPYPFFRPALREFKANPRAFVADNAGITVDNIETGEGLVEAVAIALENQITTNANANRTGRSPGTDSDHPVVDTGNLVNSIQAQRIR